MSEVLTRFQPEGVLGVGPLGKVYSAVEKATGRRVAFRAFQRPPDAQPDHWQQAIDRYNRELTAAQSLEHPNVARIYEFGEEEGLYYVVTEWFDGGALRRVIDKKAKLTPDQALALVGQAGRALEYAAECGAPHGYHGDVTPFNLVVSKDGGLHVVNFGLAHCRPKEDSLYRAPEELLGREGDPRSDLFCLGLVLFELLAGSHPFAGKDHKDTQDRIMRHPTPGLPGGPPYLQAILGKLLAKRVQERYQSWGEVAADIARARAPEAPQAAVLEASPGPLPAAPSLSQYRLSTPDALAIRGRLLQRLEAGAERRRAALRLAFRAGLAALLVASVARAAFRRSTENAVRLTEIGADVQVARPPKREWIKARAGQPLAAKDLVRTGKESAQIALGDGTRLLIGPHSLLGVQDVRFRAKSRTRLRTFSLTRGVVYSRVRARPNQRFVIRTPDGTATAMGTDFVVRTSTQTASVIQTLSGTVVAQNQEGSVQVPSGTQTTLAKDEKPAKPTEMAKTQLQDLAKALDRLAQSDPGVLLDLLIRVEDSTLTRLADGVQGLVDDTDVGFSTLRQGSARARAQGAMQALTYALEMGDPESGYPETLDVKTLAEINPSEEMREQILTQFQDHKLAYYKRLPNGYEVAARLKDESRTLIVVRNGKITIRKAE